MAFLTQDIRDSCERQDTKSLLFIARKNRREGE